MELEKQVVSLELAKKLKSLGCKQESLFWWTDDEDSPLGEMVVGTFRDINSYSAFTVAELGQMLPMCQQFKTPIGWVIRYENLMGSWEDNAKTEADARAKMICYLLRMSLLKSKLTTL